MKNIVLILISLFVVINLHAQSTSFQWVKTNQGSQGSATAGSSTIDSLGNIYIIGSFTGTIDFNPSVPLYYGLTAASTGSSTYIQKLNANGGLVWVKKVDFISGGLGPIKIGDNGNLIIIGNFKDSVDIDPGTGVYMLHSNGGYDAYILKLSANGIFIWAKSFGGPEDDVVSDMIVDKSGNLYSHGSYKDTVDFDPGSGTCIYGTNYTPPPNPHPLDNAFIQKLDKSGNFIWAKTFQCSESFSDGYFIDLDSDDNIYCTGYFSGTGVDFDPGSGISIPPLNNSSMYLVKLDSLGSFIWARFSTKVGIGGYANPDAMVVDRFNNIFITGYSKLNIDFDPGLDTLLLSTNTFIQKYDQNGNFLWAKSYGYGDQPTAITTDTFGNVYSTGFFMDSTDLAPGLDTLIFYTYPNNWYDHGVYVQKLNSNGDFLWAGVLQGNLGSSIGCDISVDYTGNVFLAGEFVDTVDFDPSSSIHNLVSANPPWASSYLLKLSQCQVITTDYVTACDSLTWMDGVTYYNSTQSAYFTLPSTAGCDSIICLNLNVPIIDNTINVSTSGVFSSNQNFASYQWLDCNNGLTAFAGDTLQTFTPTQNGDYAVAINVNGCVDTSACININNVSMEEMAGNTIKLYPNPNSGRFTLDLGNLNATELSLLNSLGQKMLSMQDINKYAFDLELQPGVYFIQIRTADASKTIRFIVN
ncbi:MAG: hypothetical protein DRI84_08085 [Bacteroidetes bacterium]|nr:MAG: hypothetical protein DRI84_08085 [Bacteroidota bacterium]